MAITVLDLARHRLNKPEGNLNGQDFEDAGLAIMGGCYGCGASLAAYNAYPTTQGSWSCNDCLYGQGWDSVSEADKDIFGKDAS